jgi:hypothetical protein
VGSFRTACFRVARFPGERRSVLSTFLSVFLLTCALTLVAIDKAAADELDCIAHSRGGTVRWDSSWQSDQQDDNVLYRIASVQDHQSKTSRTVTLELAAVTRAKRNIRYLSIGVPATAKVVCFRISAPSHADEHSAAEPEPSVTAAQPKPTPTADDNNTSSFIKYSDAQGWILADPPPYQALTTCEVLGKAFRCLLSDKQKHGSELSTIEDELRIRPR